MNLLRGLGKAAGKTAGLVIGGPIQVVGVVTGVKLIEEIGRGTRTASEFAGDTLGQVASGTVDTVSGIIKEDSAQRDRGLGEVGNAVSRTAKGVFTTAKNTLHSGGEVIGGFTSSDNERVKKGASDIVKTLAVGTLAVGLIDVIDGSDNVEASQPADNSTNSLITPDSMEVSYEEKTIMKADGEVITDSFPVFDPRFETTINEDMYLRSDYIHFTYANYDLYDAIQVNPHLATEMGLSETDIQNLSNGDNPEGYTWHHHEDPGLLQLVETEIHQENHHLGGREIWGGGSEFR